MDSNNSIKPNYLLGSSVKEIMKKLQVSDVLKKDLEVLAYLMVFGGVTVVSQRYLQAGEMSVLFGATANYILFRVKQELASKGYKQALKK